MASVGGSRKRVYLHVGVPKSGTSFIQATLRENKRRLIEHGFQYPTRHRDDMFHAALDVNGNHERWQVPREVVEGAWTKLCRRAEGFDGTTIISSEFLCGARPEQIHEALGQLGDMELHVVVTARDMARQIPAEWQEGIKHGRTVTFGQFQKRILDPEREHPHARRFWHYQDLPQVLSRWADEVSDEHTHLVTCPPPGADRSLLWERFCSAVDLDPAVTEIPESTLNTSLGVREIQVLRHVNRAVNRSDQPGRLVRPVKQHLVRRVLRDYTSPRPTTPAELIPELRELTKDWRTEIEGHRYDVVGSLADLEPVEPKAPALDPDRVPVRETLTVASEAITALITEVERLRADNHALRLASLSRRSLLRRAASRVRRSLRR